MIIDFHTHAFPDSLAHHAVQGLADSVGMEAYADGKVGTLRSIMQKEGITHSVLLTIVVRPGQGIKTNGFAGSFLNEAKDGVNPAIIPFASVHPYDDNWKEQLHQIRDAGYPGIKLHGEYQGFAINDPRLEPVFKTVAELGLILVLHVGDDDGMPDSSNTTVEKVADMLPVLELGTTVLAHMGANGHPEEVLELFAGRNVYFDTSYSLPTMDLDLAKKLFLKHGPERFLFGSDYPWAGPGEALHYFRDVVAPGFLNEQDVQRVLGGNAAKLLKL